MNKKALPVPVDSTVDVELQLAQLAFMTQQMLDSERSFFNIKTEVLRLDIEDRVRKFLLELVKVTSEKAELYASLNASGHEVRRLSDELAKALETINELRSNHAG